MSNNKRYLSDNKGSAMVLAIIMSVVLLVLVIIGVALVKQQSTLVAGSRHKSQALSVAEAGLDAAIWRLERNGTLSAGDFNGFNSEGEYTVTVETPDVNNATHYVIKSLGEHTDSGKKRKVEQDIFYINLSRAVYSYSGANGGGQTEGSINIRGPFYTSGDLNLNGNVGIYNLDGTTGNPLMIRGNLIIGSAGVDIGGNTETLGKNSPMAVFVKGTIDRPNQVFSLVSKQVPEISMPNVVSSQFLDAAQGNDNAVYTGDLTLDSTEVKFGLRDDGSYTFHYVPNANNVPATLTTEGIVYFDGDLITDKKINYQHGSYGGTNYTKSTIFVSGQLTINQEIRSLGTYPSQSVLALVNEDDTNLVDDVYIDVSTGASNPPLVQSFIYTSGQITINKKVKVQGSVMTKLLQLNQVPDLEAPDESVKDNYPYLYPGKDLAFIATSNWREVSPQ